MPDGSLHPEEAAELIRELNESGMYGRRAGRPLIDPQPPPPPGPPVEEPPLPDDILAEINAGRRASGLPEEPGGVTTQPAPSTPAPVWATRAAPGPSGLEIPVVLALKEGQLLTSAGDVVLTTSEHKAFKDLCARILKRKIRETLSKIGP